MAKSDPLLTQRRDIARRIDRVLGEHPDVSCIYVLGSVPSGHVDDRSDVGIAVVSLEMPLPVSVRENLLGHIGAGWQFYRSNSDDPLWKGNAMPEKGDEGEVDGVRVEVQYQAAPDISRIVDQVVSQGAITTKQVPVRPYTLIGMLRRAWVLRDKDGVFEGWLKQTDTYPRLLKLKILRQFVPVLQEHAADFREYAERRAVGPSTHPFFLSRASDAMASILYALNDMYDPADKRAERTIMPALDELPRDFVARFKYVMEGPFDDGGAAKRSRAFSELAVEVLAMAEAEL